MIANAVRNLRGWGTQLGPYLLLEILLPGGTLFALALYLSRQIKPDLAARTVFTMPRTLAVMLGRATEC